MHCDTLVFRRCREHAFDVIAFGSIRSTASNFDGDKDDNVILMRENKRGTRTFERPQNAERSRKEGEKVSYQFRATAPSCLISAVLKFKRHSDDRMKVGYILSMGSSLESNPLRCSSADVVDRRSRTRAYLSPSANFQWPHRETIYLLDDVGGGGGVCVLKDHNS